MLSLLIIYLITARARRQAILKDSKRNFVIIYYLSEYCYSNRQAMRKDSQRNVDITTLPIGSEMQK